MEEVVKQAAEIVALIADAIAILVIAYGAAEAFSRLAMRVIRGPGGKWQRKEIWLGFGMWLVIGLEFELAADVVRSVISPTWADIGQLGAIAVIRTALNYFLERDLEIYREPDRARTDTSPAA